MGRGQGQRRFYTFDPTDQLIALLEYRRQRVPTAECAIRLWLCCYPIEMGEVRRHLPRALRTVQRFRKMLRSPSFSTQFAEYLHNTPRARDMWLGGRTWNRDHYDDAVALAEAMVAENPEAQSRVAAAATRFANLSEEERALIVQLGGDPDALMGSTFAVFRRIFTALERATDEDLYAARGLQRKLVVIMEVNRRIAALMPNVLSSLMSKFTDHDDLRTSWGLFAGFGMMVVARDDELDIASSLQQRIDEFSAVAARLEAESPVQNAGR